MADVAPEVLSTIRWKLSRDPSMLTAEESVVIYAILGERLGYPAEDLSTIEPASLEVAPTNGQDLKGKNVALVIGHESGGGAAGEREWNIKVASNMQEALEARGASVLVYIHKTKSYTKRCYEMKSAINKQMPNADCVVLLHYNAVSNPAAHGHEFHYGGYPALAKSFRDEWQKDNPDSRARQDNGILHNNTGRGSLMIKLAPAPCVLTEPFFISNPKEKARHSESPADSAKTFTNATAKFLLQ